MTELESRIIAAARRWYHSTNEAELAEAVHEYESSLRMRPQTELELTGAAGVQP